MVQLTPPSALPPAVGGHQHPHQEVGGPLHVAALLRLCGRLVQTTRLGGECNVVSSGVQAHMASIADTATVDEKAFPDKSAESEEDGDIG